MSARARPAPARARPAIDDAGPGPRDWTDEGERAATKRHRGVGNLGADHGINLHVSHFRPCLGTQFFQISVFEILKYTLVMTLL
jgi:hypothetical protein